MDLPDLLCKYIMSIFKETNLITFFFLLHLYAISDDEEAQQTFYLPSSFIQYGHKGGLLLEISKK